MRVFASIKTIPSLKPLFIILSIACVLFTSGCIIDTDKDGHFNWDDDYPEDARYYSDKDGDGYADEIDAFPTSSAVLDEDRA
ncbi:MAG: hypothetical protein ACXQTE_06810 [Methanosarcinaceae archaeon]